MDFDTAKSGTIGLESAFGALQTVLPLDIIIGAYIIVVMEEVRVVNRF